MKIEMEKNIIRKKRYGNKMKLLVVVHVYQAPPLVKTMKERGPGTRTKTAAQSWGNQTREIVN